MSVFKLMRIVALLTVFFVIIFGTWMTERRLASWDRPAWVTVYPIVADDEPGTMKFARSIDVSSFDEVNEFMERETRPYGIQVTPAFQIQVTPVSTDLPPPMPDQYSPAAIAWWSLKMRWWTWQKGLRDGLVEPDIQMFILYNSTNGSREMDISVGMRKGRYGVVNAYASNSMNQQNLVVFAHELMHVFGASDKYVRSTGEPEYPFGFADPDQRPLFPQKRAEIMGGRIPLSSFDSRMPRSLKQCKIGRRTAEEIGFFDQLMK